VSRRGRSASVDPPSFSVEHLDLDPEEAAVVEDVAAAWGVAPAEAFMLIVERALRAEARRMRRRGPKVGWDDDRQTPVR